MSKIDTTARRIVAVIKTVWSVIMFLARTAKARVNYLIGFCIYLIIASGWFGALELALVPPILLVTLYLAGWALLRAKVYSDAGRELPNAYEMVTAWWRERSRLEQARRRWAHTCEGYGLIRSGSTDVLTFKVKKSKAKIPPLLEAKATLDGDVECFIEPDKYQIPMRKLIGLSNDLAPSMGCHEVMIRPTRTPGKAKMGIYWSNPLDRTLYLKDLPKAKDRRLCSYAIRRDGTALVFRKDHSLLIGGLSGQGKSNLLWVLIASFLADDEWIDLYISDAKGGIELDALGDQLRAMGFDTRRLRVMAYADNAKDTIEKVIPAVVTRMDGRRKWMKGQHIRKMPSESTQKNPYIILIVDEITLIDTELKKGTAGKLGHILSGGRASNCVAWLATQDGRVETIPGSLRTLIPGRVCFATDNSAATVAILGDKAESERGAKCSQLDEKLDMGICYAGSEESRICERARVPYVTDRDITVLVVGKVPPAMLNRTTSDEKPCLVYWLPSFPIKAANGETYRRLEYVGVTDQWCDKHEKLDTCKRFAQHRLKDWAWCSEHGKWENWFIEHIDVSAARVIQYNSRARALVIEERSIKKDKPIWNKVHNWANLHALRVRSRSDALPGEKPARKPSKIKVWLQKLWKPKAELVEPDDVITGQLLDEESDWPVLQDILDESINEPPRELESADQR